MNSRLVRLVQPLVEDLGYEFVGLEHGSNPKQGLLRVYIDQSSGVDIEDCERVSRELAALLDVEDPIPGQYNLEVSSPGLDRPLFTLAQYHAFIGAQAQLNTFAPVNGRRKYKGVILAAADDAVRIEQDGEAVEIAFGNIAKGRLVPDYDALLKRQNR